jgi:hypothetical protein
MFRFRFALGLAILVLSAGAIPARAEGESQKIPRSALMNLARQFVDRVGKDIAATGEAESEASTPAENQFASIPDGEPLLLQVRLGRMEINGSILDINRTILGIKEGNDVMVSLSDFVIAADFAIRVDAESGRAEGWFIRENQKFILDSSAKTVTILDKTFPIKDGDVRTENDDILVKGQTLGQWFNFKLDVDVSMQRMDILAAQKWPIEEKLLREKKKESGRGSVTPPPKLPLVEEKYALATVPNIDVALRQSYVNEPKTGFSESRTNYTVQAAGDLAMHTMKATISGNQEQKLAAVYTNFSRESKDQDLLGVLKARRYEFGDINSVGIPYAGPAPGELGVRVTNRDPYQTTGALTQITGSAPPGWDVEIYRNDQFSGITTADEGGRYSFDSVLLYAGDNLFRIVQYGPQGEIREEKQSYYVSSTLYGSGSSLYDVSVSLQESQTYSAYKSQDPDRNRPHVAATYERQITPKLSMHGGIQSIQENDIPKFYTNVGAVTSAYNAIFNGDITYDMDGPYKIALAGRKRFKTQNFAAFAFYESENFNPGSGNIPKPSATGIRTVSTGPVPWIGYPVDYEIGSSYSIRGDNSTQYETDLSLTTRVDRIVLGNTISRSVQTKNDVTTEDASGAFSARGRAFNTLIRGTLDYEILPETNITQYLLRLSRGITPKVDIDVDLRHKPLEKYSIAEVGVNWTGDHMILSPSISYDSNQAINAFMNMRFGLARDPYNDKIVMSGRQVTSNGGVSAKVFLDRDGDNIFSDGDELLEGVVVEAIHARREAETDANGEAFLYNLPTTLVTDIAVQEGSAFDPAWVSGFPGISLRPRPGHVTRIEFPIHMSGEVDGVLYARNPGGKPRELRSIHLRLYDGDGKVVQSTITPQDGFFLFTRIPPGRYFIVPDPDDLKAAKMSGTPPVPVDIGFEGTVIAGKNIILDPAGGASFNITGAEALRAAYPDAQIPLQDETVILNLGSYHSSLTMAVVWYKLKMRYGVILAGTEALFKPSLFPAEAKSGLYTLRLKLASGNMEDAARRCRALSARGLYCQVELIPVKKPQQRAEAKEQAKGG